MNTAKHTPGPWEVVGSRICTVGNDRERVTLAKTEPSGAFTMSTEQTANAHLIAAAPAMYIELKEGLVLLEASHHDMVDMYGIDSLQAKTVWDRIESTRNVIAQAEGR